METPRSYPHFGSRRPKGYRGGVHLVGVDIGFSLRRRSNGIAIVRDGELIRAERLSVEERDTALRSLTNVDVVAIDAPLLPPGGLPTMQRECERTFSRGAFQKRCKPGMSHIRGTGQLLREHGRRAAEHLAGANALRPSAGLFPRVWRDTAIVEAFPNAFLGVAVPDEDFVTPRSMKRGGKFDWLYDRWVARNLFAPVVDAAGLPEVVASRCVDERDHDVRAALVCLITAAFAASGDAVTVGREVDGYFFLPPGRFWAGWATDTLRIILSDMSVVELRPLIPTVARSSREHTPSIWFSEVVGLAGRVAAEAVGQIHARVRQR
jgi:predicted nuclease with RNAse H fold